MNRLILASSIFLIAFNAYSQNHNYIWPTNASDYLTSSFAEYRSGHFHAGIDIKTWGQEGYQVYAIRDGYVHRIRVSPYGYGKAIYLKLNSGEIVVYAHLQRFNAEIEELVKQEQKRIGEYRIDKYLPTSRYPVKQGEVIAYTGSTGIGYPHLHFEMRDSRNRPVNPFLFGYKVKDTISPVISAIAVKPLDHTSRVNSDVKPYIVRPTYIGPGKYRIEEKILVSGKIGFAIDCFDQANGVNNKFAAYRLNFYVDGELKFSAVYNRFSYSETDLIVFERDYRLKKRGEGIFQKLYKEKENTLSFYTPDGNEIGMIYCDPSATVSSGNSNSRYHGTHKFRIETADFNGNVSAVQGYFVTGKKSQIFSKIEIDNNGNYFLRDLFDEQGNTIHDPQLYVSSNEGRTWSKASLRSDSQISSSLLNHGNPPVKILKIVAKDMIGRETFPSFATLSQSPDSLHSQVEFEIKKDFYDDFVRLDIDVNGNLKEQPIMIVQQMGDYPREVELIQEKYNSYYGIHKLIPGRDGALDIEVQARDLAGKEVLFWDQFDIATVTPSSGGSLVSEDKKCRVSFGANRVYRNLFLRIDETDTPDTNKYDVIGLAYNIEPQDVPLKRSALVSLKYPADDPLPEKLGVYGSSNKRYWGFQGNRLNENTKQISARISGLRFVTILRDTIPPEIVIYSPKQNARYRSRKPLIRAYVRDRLAGIRNERSIIIRVDGQKVISEYDPEKRIVKYVPDEPLATGWHRVTVWAKDNSDNDALEERRFYVGQ
ncbi:peptidoglycan DD-metalloendopeptidase family protein [candidate division KSB1 bacterium]|nr:peptidoglycan DD-metalloendopeptidase family protein [candidate division KSB1 bacterium]